ncbi:MAG: PQQ-dependent dehydrogenase, methanol/ethanol family [Woeseiaceae bacterium]|nr:PQQ-dependent dehydrogenase, methanol/ethanol family [Woeseiaceae bacterium]
MRRRYCLPALALLFAACSPESADVTDVADVAASDDGTGVTEARIIAADAEPQNWLSHGRTYSEQRYSPLSDIDTSNVGELGLAWYFDVPTDRGMEATPIVVDGRMYVTGSWSIVYALDAATGEELWRYDPQVPRQWAQYACCDVVNRGVAAWGDSVFVGTLDGYLISLDAATGEVNWRVDTINRTAPYTITGAPRVVKGLVLIGNGGGEYGVRGYIGAYDAESGDLAWRFHTVPGNPEDGFENDAMAMAAETWTGEWWTMGGGGTVWDSMAYDPELDLLYIGVGNGSPWNRKVRSPDGGDNLFISSIVALRPETGEYVWHYQTTPGDMWDFTATQHMILADIEIEDETRKVLMQAPKNGFFYVIDRTNGELLSAENYVTVNWASGIDPATGRPIEAPNARYDQGPFMIMPGPVGGHNWQPMAYNPETELVYVPTHDIPFVHADEAGFEFVEGSWNTATDFAAGSAPEDLITLAGLMSMVTGQLVAWDPVEQREVWRYQHAGPWNAGVLSTGGGLVFQGSMIGEFAAYDATSGERLWAYPVQTGVAAAPSTYSVDGEQHVAVAVGWGTLVPLLGGEAAAAMGMTNYSRVLAFRTGGSAELPLPPPREPVVIEEPPEQVGTAEEIALGQTIYANRCWSCHGDDAASGGVLPDLRHSTAGTHAIWDTIVLEGAYEAAGMPGFGHIFTEDESRAVQAYVIDRTRQLYERQNATR